MNDGTNAARVQEGDTAPDFEEGRYLYCVVYADDGDTFSTDGIEDEPVSLLVEDGIGAIVQPVDSAYDSEDLTQVQGWLLAHQQVVDEAGQTFGTPLPFRFDTIIKGDDETVRAWLADHHDEIDDALDWLADRWEYRIEVRWDREAVAESLLDEDEELRELAARAEDASEGTGFLLEKQYQSRLADRIQARRESLEATLRERIGQHAVEIRRANGGDGRLSSDDGDGLQTAVRLSVLADSDREEAIGEVLESVGDRPAHEVQYTGPWPPYSHAPQIGDRGGDEA